MLLFKDQNKISQKTIHSPSSRKLTYEIRTRITQESLRKKTTTKIKN